MILVTFIHCWSYYNFNWFQSRAVPGIPQPPRQVTRTQRGQSAPPGQRHFIKNTWLKTYFANHFSKLLCLGKRIIIRYHNTNHHCTIFSNNSATMMIFNWPRLLWAFCLYHLSLHCFNGGDYDVQLTLAALGLGLKAPEGRPGPSRGLTESREFWAFFFVTNNRRIIMIMNM